MHKLQNNSVQIAQLAAALIRHKQLYYAGQPAIDDQEYDRLEQELQSLDPYHPALVTVGSETGTNKRQGHDSPMLSLEKTYKIEDLSQWMQGEALVGTPKIDGNSLSLVYQQGLLVLAKTRGDGRVGEDVTEKARWIADCRPPLAQKFDYEVRGEVFCNSHQFALLVQDMLDRGLERPSNPRNIVAGLLGRKQHLDLCRYFNFFAFDVLTAQGELPFTTEFEKFSWLVQQGFQVPPYQLLQDEAALEPYLNEVRQWMATADVAYDGAVFTYNRSDLQKQLGNTSHHPRFKLAFKWQGQTAVSLVKRIEWATSRLGIVTPVAEIETVQLSGAQISNVTLHNAEFVQAYNIKPGDKIELVRSGEVIPKFLQVVEPAPGTFTWPMSCPACQLSLEFDGVRLKCQNQEDCPAQRSGLILNWIKAVEIDDLSDKRLEQMMQLGLVKQVVDLYRLELDDLLTMPATKAKMAAKLLAHIQASRDLPLARFLNGLGIEGAGLRTWEKLLEHFPSLEALQSAQAEDLQHIDGFAEKSALQIVQGLQQKKTMIEQLLDVGVFPKITERKHALGTGPLAGQQFVLTGSLSRPREFIERLIREAGGKTGSVSKHTFALVTNDVDTVSSKMKKARDLGVPIWSETQLMQHLEA